VGGGGWGGANRILRTENSKNPVTDPPGVDHAQSRPRSLSADNAPSAKTILTEVRKILDPPLVNGAHKFLRKDKCFLKIPLVYDKFNCWDIEGRISWPVFV
jgi:hypothetical protein